MIPDRVFIAEARARNAIDAIPRAMPPSLKASAAAIEMARIARPAARAMSPLASVMISMLPRMATAPVKTITAADIAMIAAAPRALALPAIAIAIDSSAMITPRAITPWRSLPVSIVPSIQIAATRMLQETASDRRIAAPLPMKGSLLTTIMNPDRIATTAARVTTPWIALPVSMDPSVYTARDRITQDTARARRIPAPFSTPLVAAILVMNSCMVIIRIFMAARPTTAPLRSIPARIRTAVAIKIIAAPIAMSIATIRTLSFLKATILVMDSSMSSIILNRNFKTARVTSSFGAGTRDIRISAPARTPRAIAIVRRALALTFCSNASRTPPSLSNTLPSLSATFPILSKFSLKELIHRVKAMRTPPPIAPTSILPMS